MTLKEEQVNDRQLIKMCVCLFCQEGNEEANLFPVLIFDADKNIQTMIAELKDTILLSRIDGGDLIAQEAKYHLKLVLYRFPLFRLNRYPIFLALFYR